ncbi:MAG TPA: aldolase [Methanothrix sp.]|nr:aldolase [Methanothrix sp.]HOV81151.1 aldolase [Methanothrix sp.]HPC88942.1 aldolase [Methanothrix sp.]HQE86876.1 aldolase [Methanothrix sp.]HQI67513.1 aldolase [Methanothrix sp.]
MHEEQPWREIARYGRKAVASGLTSSRFGNISIAVDDSIFITCTGSMLDELDESQIVRVDLAGPCPMDETASSETCVHRAVYQRSTHRAVIHTHSPYAVAMSILETEQVIPLDSEGLIFLGAVPVVQGRLGSEELGGAVSSALVGHQACIARSHGVFAAGKSLTEAYTAACMVEHSAQVGYLVKAYRQ